VHDHHFNALQVRESVSRRTLDLSEAFVLVLKDNT
jgi:hypothetical protein